MTVHRSIHRSIHRTIHRIPNYKSELIPINEIIQVLELGLVLLPLLTKGVPFGLPLLDYLLLYCSKTVRFQPQLRYLYFNWHWYWTKHLNREPKQDWKDLNFHHFSLYFSVGLKLNIFFKRKLF